MIPQAWFFWARIGSICALVGGLFIGAMLALNRAEKRGYDRAAAEYTAAALRAEEANRAKDVAWRDKLARAENESRKQRAANDAAAAAMRSELGGLRDELAKVRRDLPDAPGGAVVERADTLATVFAECAAEVAGLAAKADRHADDAKRLRDAWPR